MTRKAWLWTFLIACVVWPATVVLTATAVASANTGFQFEFHTDPDRGISGDPFTLGHLAGAAVPADLQGRDCSIVLDLSNNESVRSGTDVVISSGGVNLESALTHNVEATKGDRGPVTAGNVALGPYVNAWVRFGPAGEASIDGVVHVNCPDSPPPPPDEPVCLIESCDTTPPPVDPPKPPNAVVNTPRFAG